jgi:hypothetical protein
LGFSGCSKRGKSGFNMAGWIWLKMRLRRRKPDSRDSVFRGTSTLFA